MASQRVTSGIRAEAFIHTEPALTWRMWTDPTELTRWFPGVASVTKQAAAADGTNARVQIEGPDTVEIEILTAEEPTELTYRLPSAFGDLKPNTGTILIKASLTGTEVSWTVKLDNESRGFLGLGGSKGGVQRTMQAALDALKTLLEAEAYRRPEVDSDVRRSRWDDI